MRRASLLILVLLCVPGRFAGTLSASAAPIVDEELTSTWQNVTASNAPRIAGQLDVTGVNLHYTH